MTPPRGWLTGLLLAVSLWALGPAVARGEGEAEQAKAHFEAGQRLFEDGRYGDAAAEFQKAYEIKPHPDVRLSIAIAYERLYRPVDARRQYEQFLAETPADTAKARFARLRLQVLVALPGSIVVETSPQGGEVRLDGEGRTAVGRTPHRFDGLPPGRYQVRVTLADHAPADVRLELAPGGQDIVNLPLAHLVETLTVFSRPEGARVFLDERALGVTPLSQPIEVGRGRRLRLEKEDYPPHDESLDVVAGAPVRREIVLKRPLRTARSELVLAGMVYGGFGSVAIAEAAGGVRLPGLERLAIDLASGIGGVGLGFLVTAFTTTDELKVGHSSVMIGSTVWGATLAGSLGLGLRFSDVNLLAATLLGSGLGLGTGILVARYVDPSPGDAALVNSGGVWGSAIGLLLAQAIRFSGEQRRPAFGWLTLSGAGLGLLGTSLLAWRLETSRGRVALVDAFGLAGLALGFSIGFGVATPEGSEPSDPIRLEGGARFGLGGLAAGLLVGAILSRRFRDDVPPGRALLNRRGGRWAVGVPHLGIGFQVLPEGTATQVSLQLAGGDL